MVKLKNKDVMIMNECLMYLSSKQTQAWYGVSKNLRALKPIVEEINATKDEIVKNLSKKDTAGEILYVGEGAQKVVVWEDQIKADELWKECMQEESENISFYNIPYSKFGEVELDALMLEPLMDIIITD